MRYRQIASIWSTNWRSLVQSGIYWRFAVVHLVVTGAAVAVTWPSSTTFDAPALPVTINAFLYAKTALLAYTAIALAAENFSNVGNHGAIDWVYHGVATPAEVVVARFLWTGFVMLSLAGVTLPIAIAAYSVYPIPAASMAGALSVVVATLLCYTAVGQVMSATISERSLRVIATDGFFTLSGIMAFLASGWIGSPSQARSVIFNPLGAIHHFLSAQTEPPFTFPWAAWLAAYGIVLALFLGLAYRKLWEWSPPPDWGPEPSSKPYRRQGPKRRAAKPRAGAPPVDGGEPR